MISKQRVKTFARTLYSALAITALTLPGCKPNYTNTRNIPAQPVKQTLEKKLQDENQNPSEIKGSQNYDSRYKGYRVNGDFEINGIRVGEYSDEDENIIFFDGKEHEGVDIPYISIGKSKLVLGVPANGFGSTVELLPGNAYVEIEKENFVMIQALGGKKAGAIWIENKNWDGKIPRVTSCASGYNIFNGQRAVKYNKSVELTNKGPGILNDNPIDTSGKVPIPLHVVTTDRIGQRLYPWDIVFNKYGEITAGVGRELDNYPGSLSNGEYTSIRQAYHNLTLDEQRKEREKIISKNIKQGTQEVIEVIPRPEPISEEYSKPKKKFKPSMPPPKIYRLPNGRVVIEN